MEVLIINHLIYIKDNGSYADITIMDVYSIMYCYDDCFDSIDDEHKQCNCICDIKFQKNNNILNLDKFNDQYKEIRTSVKNHYEKTKKIKILYDNLKEYIYENITKTEILTFLSDHDLWFGDNNNFLILHNCEVIAYSENHVIIIIKIPQFNTINFNEKIIECIIKHFMILNVDHSSRNHVIFSDKIIHTCILSLDYYKPIFYDFKLKKDDPTLVNVIKSVLLKKYSNMHLDVHKYYIYCSETKTGNCSITYCLDQLYKYRNLPKYIIEYFYKIKLDIDKCKENNMPPEYIENNILNKVRDVNIFLQEMYKCLEDKIDDFLGIKNNKYLYNYDL